MRQPAKSERDMVGRLRVMVDSRRRQMAIKRQNRSRLDD